MVSKHSHGAPHEWRPDDIEAFAIRHLDLDAYYDLKKWPHRSWVQAAYPDDPTDREMEFN